MDNVTISQNTIPFVSVGTHFIIAQARVNSVLQEIPYFELPVNSFTGYFDICDFCWSLVRQRVGIRITLQSFCLS